MRYNFPQASLRIGSTIYFWNEYYDDHDSSEQADFLMHRIFLDEDNTIMMDSVINLPFLRYSIWDIRNFIAISSVPAYCVFG